MDMIEKLRARREVKSYLKSASLRFLRLGSGLTQKDVAKEVGVNPSVISRVERGFLYGVSVETQIKLMKVYKRLEQAHGLV